MHAEPVGLRGAQVGNLWSRICLEKSGLLTEGLIAIAAIHDHEPAPYIWYCHGLLHQDHRRVNPLAPELF